MSEKTNVASKMVTRHEKLAEAARQLARILDEFPELATELAAEFAPAASSSGSNGKTAVVIESRAEEFFPPVEDDEIKPDISNLDKVAQFFVSRDNKLVATPEISPLSGIGKYVVSNVLWSARAKKLFEQHDHPDNKKTKMWRLKREEFERRKAAAEVKA